MEIADAESAKKVDLAVRSGRTVDDDQQYASTAQVAKALGPSVTTVKRWVDDGILPARKTAGGHRKVLMADVLQVMRESNLPMANIGKFLPRSRSVDFASTQSILIQLNEALLHAEVDLIRALLLGAMQNGFAMHTIADEIVGPALVEIGRLWESGQIDVMHEHRATLLVLSSLYEIEGKLVSKSATGRPVAVGGAPAGDPTLVPTLLAKLVLLDSGWDAVNLGPNTPASAFLAAIDELKPSLIWLCVTHLEEPEAFLAEFQKLHRVAAERGIPVAVGGSGLTKPLREKMPYTTFGDGMGHLTAFARTLHQRPAVPRRGRPRKTD